MAKKYKDLAIASESIAKKAIASLYALEDDLDVDGEVPEDDNEEEFYEEHPEQAVVEKQYDSEASDEAIEKGQDAFEAALYKWAMEDDSEDDEDLDVGEDEDADDDDSDSSDDEESAEDAIESLLGF